ncbi:MAG: InlB B-repeat-containing protein, partial [Microbacteriaceae bacterium]
MKKLPHLALFSLIASVMAFVLVFSGNGIFSSQSAFASGTVSITAPVSAVATTYSSFTSICSSSCDVSGFDVSDEVQVVISKSGGSALSGRVRLNSDTGLDDVTGYATDPTNASGYAEIAFIGTQAEANAALETLQYKGPAGGGDETISISASLNVSGAAADPSTGHFYEIVDAGSSIAWEDARCRAMFGNSSAHDNTGPLTQSDDECTNTGSRRTLNGLNGYLANITSLEEHNFLRTKLTGVGWIGGADLDTEGSFQWVDGPEAGQTFFIFGTSTRRTTNTINSVSQFNYFSDGEPNNHSGLEDFVEFGFGTSGDGSSWNDCQNGCGRTKFVVEYGGNGGTVLKQASTTINVETPGPVLSYNANTTQHQAGALAVGSSLPADANVEGGTSFTVASAASRTGFVFVEWNTAADGSGTSYVAGASRSMPSSNLT